MKHRGFILIYLDENPYTKYSTRSPKVAEFEKAMAQYLGVSDCVAVNSGTSALHLALLACGIEDYDTVIIPVLTFIATANAISYTGAGILFEDVHPKTWVMCGHYDEDFIVGVDLYGNECDAATYLGNNIGDCAESLGLDATRSYQCECYSFNGNKTMSTGSGGLIVGLDIEKIRELANVGRKKGEFNSIGYNYRMNGISAEMGLKQLPYLDKWVAKKRRFNQIYREQLSDIIQFQEPTPGSNPSWWFTAGLFEKGRDIISLQKKLSANGIPTRRIFQPLNQLKPYRTEERFPVAEDIYNRGLCLPSSTLNSEKDILRACKIIKGGGL